MKPLHELVAQLISIPSVNTMGRSVTGPEYGEAALTDFLEGWLSGLGIQVARQNVSPGRDNLIATVKNHSSRHVLMEVHQDTVPVEGMTVEPFTPKVEGDLMYGRGACDNKGPMAAMLWALKRLAEEKPDGAPTVTLALTVDEEHTFTGVRKLVNEGLTVDVAVVAEPTELDIVVAHKGVVRWVLETKGQACHSSAPTNGINATYRMGPILSAMEKYASHLPESKSDPLLGVPTISVGRIEGGISVNIVPDSCRIEIDRRLIPGEDPNQVPLELGEYLRNHLPGTEFEIHDPWLQSPPMGVEINEKLTQAFGQVIDQHRGSHENRTVPFGTDASNISGSGIPSIVFGPGSISKAHTKDEYVPLSEVEMAAEIYYDFCRTFTGL